MPCAKAAAKEAIDLLRALPFSNDLERRKAAGHALMDAATNDYDAMLIAEECLKTLKEFPTPATIHEMATSIHQRQEDAGWKPPGCMLCCDTGMRPVWMAVVVRYQLASGQKQYRRIQIISDMNKAAEIAKGFGPEFTAAEQRIKDEVALAAAEGRWPSGVESWREVTTAVVTCDCRRMAA